MVFVMMAPGVFILTVNNLTVMKVIVIVVMVVAMTVVLLTALKVNLIAVMVLVYQDHGNVIYTGVTVPIALMKPTVVEEVANMMVNFLEKEKLNLRVLSMSNLLERL
jgi:hypothetical protein